MSEQFPNFARNDASPKLQPEIGGIAVSAGDGRIAEVVLRGAFRVLPGDRGELKNAALRAQAWVVAVERGSRSIHLGQPGAAAVVFDGEEAKTGAVDGWFNVGLAECCKLPKSGAGLYDVTAVIGPYKSPPIAVKLRA